MGITLNTTKHPYSGDVTNSAIVGKSIELAFPIESKTPVNAVQAQGKLTIDTQPIADVTITIGSKLYTFVADGTEAVEGDISVGTDLATAQANVVGAINGTDSINTANTSNTLTISSIYIYI